MSLCKSKDLSEDFIVLTPNQRLSMRLKETEGFSYPSMPFQQWGLNLAQKLMTTGFIAPYTLLSNPQIESVWARIMAQQDEIYLPFVNTAMKARELSHQWGLSIQDSCFLDDEASKIWQTWALQFQKELSAHQWCDPQLILQHTLRCIEKNPLQAILPKQMTLLGFAQFTPFEKKFLAALKKQGVNITEQHFSQTPLFCTRKGFEHEDAELETMAQWAYQKSLTGRVACVIPQLSSVKDKIIAIFERYFGNEVLLNISLGNSLRSYPFIQAAFTGLTLLETTLKIETLSDFLLSPFYEKSLSQLSNRSLLDVNLKSKLPLVVSKSALLEILDENPLSKFFKKTVSVDLKKDYGEWKIIFQSHLDFLGWPGERPLNNEESQLIKHWKDLLENFENLTIVSEKVNFQTALKKLHTLAAQMIFQTKRSPHAKIEVLGILEAAGLSFDYVWLAGLIENVWPAPGLANPFLPLVLQRKYRLPQSSSEKNKEFCQAITQQLLTSANEIIISYPKHYQGNPVAPSLLIEALPEKEIELPQFEKIALKNKINVQWEIQKDDQAPILDCENSPPWSSEVFKDQAACPFRAYAKHRLKAKKIELPQLGFKALMRGNLVHKILEKFFKKVTTHQKLFDLEKSELLELLHKIIHQIMAQTENNLITKVEKIRLAELIFSWLEKEKNREPFAVIATEETLKTHLGKLPLHLRIDRIDQLDNHHYLIIDYKTGRVNFNPHAMEDEPQLPLYAVVSAISVDSIAFAQVRTEEMKFKIFAEQKEQWEKSLLQLADDFIQGHAAVKPKYGKETCQYCDLASLCRIKENT